MKYLKNIQNTYLLTVTCCGCGLVAGEFVLVGEDVTMEVLFVVFVVVVLLLVVVVVLVTFVLSAFSDLF